MASKFLYKMLLTGSGGAGKTSLLQRYTTNNFSGSTKMTIGVDFAVHNMTLAGIGTVTLQIWDFGGEARFRTMLPGFCKGASGALLLYSLVEPKSFFDLQDWVEVIRTNTNNVPVILVGAKKDLVEPDLPREITEDDIQAFIEKNTLNEYIEISSKTGENVAETFAKLATLMVKT